MSQKKSVEKENVEKEEDDGNGPQSGEVEDNKKGSDNEASEVETKLRYLLSRLDQNEVDNQSFLNLVLLFEESFPKIPKGEECAKLFLEFNQICVGKIVAFFKKKFQVTFSAQSNNEDSQMVELLTFSYFIRFLKNHSKNGNAWEVEKDFGEYRAKHFLEEFKRNTKGEKSYIRNSNSNTIIEKKTFRSLFRSKKTNDFLENYSQEWCTVGRRVRNAMGRNPKRKIVEKKRRLSNADRRRVRQGGKSPTPDEAPTKYIEQFFRIYHENLSRLVAQETMFYVDFFSLKNNSSSCYEFLFKKPLKFAETYFKKVIKSIEDPISLMIIINIVKRFRIDAEVKNNIQFLSSYYQRVEMLVWARFKRVLDKNIASLNIDLTSIPIMIDEDIVENEKKYHRVICRFSNFIVALLLVLNGEEEHQRIQHNIAALLKNFDKFMKEIVENPIVFVNNKDILLFNFNSYDILISKMIASQVALVDEKTQDQLAAKILTLLEGVVEYEMSKYFPKILQFVDFFADVRKLEKEEIEKTIAEKTKLEDSPHRNISKNEVEQVARQFSLNWKKQFKKIVNNIKKDVLLRQSKVDILKTCFQYISKYNDTFWVIAEKCGIELGEELKVSQDTLLNECYRVILREIKV